MAVTQTSTNDNMLMTFLQKRLLATLEPKAVLYQLAEKFPLPSRSGKDMVFNSWRRVNPASSTLGESTANVAVALSSRKVSVSIAQYGRHIEVTDLSEQTTISSPTQGAIERLMDSMAITVDNVVQLAVFKNDLDQVGTDSNAKTKILSAFMSALASAFCANTGTISTSNKQFGLPVVFSTSASRLSAVSKTAPSQSAILGPIALRKAGARLGRLNAEPYADGHYYGAINPLANATLLGNPDTKAWFVNYAEGPRESMFKGRITAPIHNIRLLISSNIPRYAVAAHSVNLTPVLGKECVGTVELSGAMESIVKRPGPSSTNDPYNLTAATVAFKVKMVAAILNPSAGCLVPTHEKV